MVTILPQEPNFGDIVGEEFSNTIRQAIPQLIQNRAKSAQQLAQNYDKLKASAPLTIDRFLKGYKAAYADNEEIKNKILKNYLKNISAYEAQGLAVDPNILMDLAISEYENDKKSKTKETQPKTETTKKSIGEDIDLFGGPLAEEVKRVVENKGSFPKELTQNPKAAAIGTLEGLGKLAEQLTGGSLQRQIDQKINPPSPLSPQEEESRQYGETVGKGLGETALFAGAPLEKLLGPSFASIKNSALGRLLNRLLGPAEATTALKASQSPLSAPKIAQDVAKANTQLKLGQQKALGEGILEKAKPNLEKIPANRPRVEPAAKIQGKENPALKATISRVERVQPESRLYKTEKEVALREKQLKNFPKYAEEIEKDAQQRALKQKKPGIQATATKEAKKAYYEKELPKTQDLYIKAQARVRALENEIAKNGADQAYYKPLLDAAKKELQETEYLYRQVYNNAKTGESRVGFDQMKKAAQEKVIDLRDKIADGAEISLSKKDYNPEFIKEAKELSKRKPLEAKKQSDYFTQVHDGYASIYKKRIAEIDEKLKSANKSLSDVFSKQNLAKERDVLQKMVDHVEAENTIHRYKMALRETAERSKAAERFKKLKPQAPGKSAEVGAKTLKEQKSSPANPPSVKPDKTKKLLEERERTRKIREQAKAKAQEKGQSFRDAFNQIRQEGNKEAAEKLSNKLLREWKEIVDNIKQKNFNLLKTKAGQSFLTGIGIDTLNNIIFETTGEKIPTGILTPLSGAITTSVTGSTLRGGVGALGSAISNILWQRARVNKVSKALKGGDSQKYREYKQKYSPKIIKKAKEQVNSA